MERTYNYKLGIWTTSKPVKKVDVMIPTNYKELQALARKLGIKANYSAATLTKLIKDDLAQKK